MSKEGKTGPDIHTKSDDVLTRILAGIEDIETKHGDKIADLCKDFSQFRETLDEHKAYITALESKIANPDNRTIAAIYGDTDEQRMHSLSDWVTNLYNKQHGLSFQERADQVIGTDADGGFLVPSPLSAEIIRIVERYGVARSIFRNMPMTATTLRLNADLAGPDVFFTAEAAAITQTKATFKQVTLTAEKLAALDELTLEVEQDAIRPLVPYLVTRFGESIAKKEDDSMFTGTSPFTGIFAHTAAAAPTEGQMALVNVSGTAALGTELTDVLYDDLVDTMHAVNENLVFSGTWLFHHTVLAQLRKLKDLDNNPIWAPMAAGAPATILGQPYLLANRAPSSFSGNDKPILMYGDYSYGVFGNRMGLEIAFSTDAGFKTASRFMRTLERIAYVTTKPNAFARLETVS